LPVASARDYSRAPERKPPTVRRRHGLRCDFTITIDHQGSFITTTYYDRDGTPIRELLRGGDHFTETYPANGRSLVTGDELCAALSS
jgi:hypothetical protein